MKTILLKGEKRAGNGTSDAKSLRAAGKVPCVMYGTGENLHFSIYEADFKTWFIHPMFTR
jgi:large subunit ribosomal protein L25